ncbi:hypothetical protein FA95DRAFT_1564313 [Auriscalpium vulgare]|uniref:Uncharacterized protein n=1 Tax=Auriscalpium vulgare TaxID=40419 RepID=A0ACB8REK2_9AGAM|nr:hypothetical protein FA95DRAFT_1564313 [Auriscalpium vulgare]
MAFSEDITTYTEEQIEDLGITKPEFLPPKGDLEDWPNFIPANANIVAGLVASYVTLNTTDGNGGTGLAFGIGGGLDITGGTLGYGSWDTLKSGRNVIGIVAEADILTITFMVDDAVAGVFVGGGVGEVTFEGVGYFDWN